MTPTEIPKVTPISKRRSPDIIPGGIVAKREMNSDGRMSLLLLDEFSSIFVHFNFILNNILPN
jgi:hypothetical protein